MIRTISYKMKAMFLFLLLVIIDTNAGMLIGDYVDSVYLVKLESTKSPLKSITTGQPQLLKISKKNDKTIINPIFDFNEGGVIFTIEADGKVITTGESQKTEFKILDSMHVKFGYGKYPERLYCFTGKFEKYAANICLAGEYLSDKGENYSFTTNGEFISSGNKSQYKIGLYYPPSFTYDYFTADSVEYAFKWSNKKMILCKVAGGSLFEDGIVDEKSAVNLSATK
jgi:hypothetical protein